MVEGAHKIWKRPNTPFYKICSYWLVVGGIGVLLTTNCSYSTYIGEHIEMNLVLQELIRIKAIRCARRLHSSFLIPNSSLHDMFHGKHDSYFNYISPCFLYAPPSTMSSIFLL